jgi:hypothetical protein
MIGPETKQTKPMLLQQIYEKIALRFDIIPYKRINESSF